MDVNQLRDTFLEFFKSKQHTIVNSAPMVVKDDPTLMFTNAGMNQFKDVFLGNSPIKHTRIADTQKCLRVSGKHNDLEEVGHDTYHHTMFEMLGNWSFGDYFKKDAIYWAWEYLIDVLKIDPDRIYASVFEGSKDDNLGKDTEAFDYWRKFLPEDKIIDGSKKDNFWEMGDQGPCGPCSEIHIDLRDDEDRKKVSGRDLVNQDHPLVIEIWNLVFIQYNRRASGELEQLPHKHVDTGMGFERLCMVVQGKKSNYDTDVFQPIIQEIAKISKIKYGNNEKVDIAMRVIADHLRTISFSITDGQLPSNTGAGYVIRRILRRAVRYGYQFLDFNEPFIYRLVDVLTKNMGEAFPELVSQNQLILKVIKEEENSFLRTLETGIKLLNQIITNTKKSEYRIVSGELAFELYDTYGFPLDLTELILKENDLIVNRKEFDEEMAKQKNRSKSAAVVDTHDWTVLINDDVEEFIGYDETETSVKITRYRKVTAKGEELYHIAFNYTPFYAESGGQIGDIGYIEFDGKQTQIIDTKKENNLIIHIAEELPENITEEFKAVVDIKNRANITKNHTSTHLLHNALVEVLGTHVEQKGSLVKADSFRFDFSHFNKLTDEEVRTAENIVNNKIRENIALDEKRAIPLKEAKAMGATALFGEKYGDIVRVIKFGESIELCGGTHVGATGEIGMIKIISEGAIASGIRRIEAISGETTENYLNNNLDTLNELNSKFKGSKNILKSVDDLIAENESLNKKLQGFAKLAAKSLKAEIKQNVKQENGVNIIIEKVSVDSAADVKDIVFQLKNEIEDLFVVIGAEINGKPSLSVMISESLTKKYDLHAGNIIREIAKDIKGGGGGQPFFATAGGKDVNGIKTALESARKILMSKII